MSTLSPGRTVAVLAQTATSLYVQVTAANANEYETDEFSTHYTKFEC